MSSTRYLVLAFVGAVLGACAGEPSSIVCPTTGITCPEGTVCAAAQAVCLTSSCGNGRSDLGEECDDGNILEGDGCSPTCKHEECGNMITDPGEACDDGNTTAGDGCSADCRTMESCGNGVVDSGEDCDDANDDNTDACVKCHTASCGDGYKRTGFEECDGDNQGNPNVVGDNCSASCQLEGCHNGRLDPDEECDDANIDNTDGCVLECKNARCGDGVIHAGIEECDGDVDTNGDGVPEDTCSDTCHLLGCGNGIKDPGEQCDDGNTDPNDGCSPTCTFEACGNGFIDGTEQCDGDGAGVGGETATCNADCTTSVCGDGKRNTHAVPTEECDNGPGNGDDKNCTTACKLSFCGDGKVDQEFPNVEACDEGPGGNINDGVGCSTMCQFEGCGNGLLDQGETCEDGNTNPNDSCVNCQIARCGDGFVQAGVEQCDGSAGTKPTNHNEATCGTTGLAACRWQYCGNGVLEGTEQCDDNNNTSGDGCTASCVREFCGDGADNNGTSEACDGGPTGSSSCNINCSTPACGDGIANTKYVVPGTGLTEQCDDGGTTSGDGCSNKCQFERCGNGVVDAGEQCDGAAGTKPIPSATCGSTGVTACRWIYCGNGILDSGEECDNGAANNNNAACTASCKVNVCGDGFQLNGIEGCDQGTNNNDNNACTSKCQPNICGDGAAYTAGAALEQCDDGNLMNNDACTTTCRTPVCGDGQVNGTTEACDDGNTNDNDGCHGNNGNPGKCQVESGYTCTTTTSGFSICTSPSYTLTAAKAGTGSGTLTSFPSGINCGGDCTESYPGGSYISIVASPSAGSSFSSWMGCSSTLGTICYVTLTSAKTVTATFASVSSVCGDGDKTGSEGCDDGNTSAGDGCSATCAEESGWTCSENTYGLSTCSAATCGDGIVAGNEVCDDHNTNACGTCNATCAAVVDDAAATGLIVVVGGASLVDGETFTLGDGANAATVFELDVAGGTAGVSGTNVAIAVAVADTADTVRGKVITAINGVAGTLAITASGSAGQVVFLANDAPGTRGNVPITETVANTSFFVSGMGGGAGHDCAATVGCQTNADCLSNSCDTAMHKCN